MKTEEAFLLVGGIAAVGLIAYFILTKKEKEKVMEKVIAEITEVALY